MAEWNRDRINPSLLDRPTDEAPGAAGGRGAFSSLSELRRSVLRDLTWLFNTTQLFDAESAEAWPQVRKSVLNCGLPPLAGMDASALDIHRVQRPAAAGRNARLAARNQPARARAAPGDRRHRAAHPPRQRIGQGRARARDA